jgi:hypothetical protein
MVPDDMKAKPLEKIERPPAQVALKRIFLVQQLEDFFVHKSRFSI